MRSTNRPFRASARTLAAAALVALVAPHAARAQTCQSPGGPAVLTQIPAIPAPPSLPEWYQEFVDQGGTLTEIQAGIATIFDRQGVPATSMQPGSVKEIVFSDADHTFLHTMAPKFFRHKTTGELLIDGQGNPVIQMRKQTLAKIKAHYPDIDFSEYKRDDTSFDSLVEIMRTHPIGPTMDLLRESDGNPDHRQIVITARGAGDTVQPGINAFLSRRDMDPDGVLAVGDPAYFEATGMTRARGIGFFNGPYRKSLTMAALIAQMDPQGIHLQKVRFLDDNDSNLRAAMALLPVLYPELNLEFWDIVHVAPRVFEHQLAGRSTAGAVQNAQGTALTPDQIKRYRSRDVREQWDAEFIGPWTPPIYRP